jgi:hypothetical protein
MPDDETRLEEEPEVEAHGVGPQGVGPQGVGPQGVGPQAAANDDSDDVEAHLLAAGTTPAAEGIPPAAE